MIPDPPAIGLFVVAALALLLVPGPAVLYVVARSIHEGRRAGLVSVLGIHVGTLAHIAAATLGLSALVVSSAVAFTAVKIAGAVYLVGLGLWTLFSSRAEPEVALGGERNLRRAFAQGIVVNVLNPKTALFFLAFLPQFVDPNAAHPALQIAFLGVLFALLGPRHRLALGGGGRHRGRDAAPLAPLRAHAALRHGHGLRRARRRDCVRRPCEELATAATDGLGVARRNRLAAFVASPATAAAAVDRDGKLERHLGAGRDLRLEPFDDLVRARRGREQPPLDLLGRVELEELLLELLREAPAAQVPAVELLEEAGCATLAELANRLPDEQDELGRDLLARRLGARPRRRSRAAPTGCPARRDRPSPPRRRSWRARPARERATSRRRRRRPARRRARRAPR